ncbi:MAG: PRC-barrel domain-containing protein [Chloroflexota bacterium]|nr:PRC-barrel domain-containing protein [Chloroflexota bacterium]
MMRNAKELRGIAIVDVKNGAKLGNADEIVVSPDDGRVLGFVMKEGTFLNRNETIVEIADVRSIGSDAITVEGEAVAHTPEAVAGEIREARSGGRDLVGRQVVTQDGSLVGTIADFAIDVQARRVAAIQIGGGLFEKSDVIAADRITSVGADVVVVSEPGADAPDRPFVAVGQTESDQSSRHNRDIRP